MGEHAAGGSLAKWTGLNVPIRPPSSLPERLVETAARALARQDGGPATTMVVPEYLTDARPIVVAVLAELASGEGSYSTSDLAELARMISAASS